MMILLRVPFTKESLKDIHKINNFEIVSIESFIQLPILFKKILFPNFLKFYHF